MVTGTPNPTVNPTGTRGIEYALGVAVRKAFRRRLKQVERQLRRNERAIERHIRTEGRLDPGSIEIVLAGLAGVSDDIRPAVFASIMTAWNKGDKDTLQMLPGQTPPPNKALLTALQQNTFGYIQKFTTEMKTELRSILTDGVSQGDSVYQLGKEIRKAFRTNAWRSETIARTEIIKGYDEGAEARFEAAGIKEYEWMSASDEVVRPLHLAMSGRRFPRKARGTTRITDATGKTHKIPASPRPNGEGLWPNCYSKNTEVMTDSGFKLFKDVEDGDKILSLDPDTKDVEYVNFVDRTKQYKENIVVLRNQSGSFHMEVSENHPLFVYLRKEYRQKATQFEPQQLQSYKDLKNNHRFYKTSEWVGNKQQKVLINGKEFDTNKFLRFVAYYLSDGSFAGTRPNSQYFMIAQSKKKGHLDRMYEELRATGFEKITKGDDKIYIWDSAVLEYLRPLGKSYEKYVPKELKELAGEHLQHFLDAYVICDGYTRPPRRMFGTERMSKERKNYFSTSKRLASDLVEILIKCGKSASMKHDGAKGKKVEHRNGVYTTNHNTYWVNELESKHVKARIVEVLPYNDYVYDVELEKNHVLLTRCNGRIVWSSNCRCRRIPVVE